MSDHRPGSPTPPPVPLHDDALEAVDRVPESEPEQTLDGDDLLDLIEDELEEGLSALPPPTPIPAGEAPDEGDLIEGDLIEGDLIDEDAPSGEVWVSGRAQRLTRPPVPPPEARPHRDHPALIEARALAEACEAELATHPEPSRALWLRRSLIRLYEVTLGDPRRALIHVARARVAAPECPVLAEAHRRILMALGRTTEALALFDTEVLLTTDPRRRAGLQWTKAVALADALGDLPEARRAFERAHSLDPHDAATHEARALAAAEAGDWAGAESALGRLAELEQEADLCQIARLLERGHVAGWRRGAAQRAVELYERAADLEIDIAPEEASGALEALCLQLEITGRWGALIPALRARARCTPDPESRARILGRIAALLHRRFDDLDGAIEALEEATALAPEDAWVLAALDPLAALAGRHRLQAATLARRVTLADGAAAQGLRHRLARVHLDELKDADEAARIYGEILSRDPLDVVALYALDALYAAAGRWAPLAEARDVEAAEAPAVARQAAALARAAWICEHHLDDLKGAASRYAAVLRRCPDDLAAFKALERLYEVQGALEALAELYEEGAESAPTEAHRLRRLMAAAQLQLTGLAQPAEAVRLYRAILKRYPHTLPAIHGLQRAATLAGDEAAILEALDAEITAGEAGGGGVPASALTPRRQAALLMETVALLLDGPPQQLDAGAVARAMKRLDLALGLAPKDEAVLDGAAEIYRRLGRWRALIEVWERRLPTLDEVEARLALHLEMAHIADHTLSDEGLALDHLEAAQALCPDHQGAVEALVRIHGEAGRWDKVAEVLEIALAETAGAEEALLRLRLGALYGDVLGDDVKAEGHLKAARALRPDDRWAVEGLIRLWGRQGRVADIAGELEAWASRCPDPRWQIEARCLAGALRWHALGDGLGAQRCYEAALEAAPDHLGAHLALATLKQLAGDSTFVDHLAARAALPAVHRSPVARLAALRALARGQIMAGEDEGHGLRGTLEDILTLAPGDPRALEGLLALALRGDRPDLLAQVAPELAAIALSPLGRADHLTSAGEALELLGRPDDALQAYHAALKADDEALGAVKGLGRVARLLDAPATLAEALRRQAGLTASGELAAGLLLQSARLALGPCRDPDQAAADLEVALVRAPAHAEAAELLISTLIEQGEGERLVQQLTAAARALEDSALDDIEAVARRADLWLEVARVHADEVRNTGAALGALRRLLRVDPQHLGGLLYTAEIYARDGQWSAAEAALMQAIEITPEGRVRRETLLQLAKLRAERLKDPEGALQAAEQALRSKRDDREALYWVAHLERRLGHLDVAAEIANRRVQISVAPSDRVEALMQLARIELDRGGSVGGRGAASALREAVVIEGPRGEAWTEYMKVVEAYDSWQAYADALSRHLRLVATAESPHLDRWLELAQVQGGRLSDPRAALESLDAAQALAPEDVALRLESARCLIDAGAWAQAASNLTGLLSTSPRSVEGWLALERAWRQGGQGGAAALATSALHVLGATESGPSVAADLALVPEGALDAEALEAYADEAPEIQPWTRALALAAEGVSRARPAEPGALGINSRDRLSPRAEHPLRQLIDHLAHIFGISGFDVYLRGEQGRTCQIALGKVPMIVVDEGLTGAPAPVQIFRVARIMAYLARGLHPAAAMDAASLDEIFRALRRIAAPVAEPGAERLDDLLRRVLKGTPRRHRRDLEELGRALASRRSLDVGPWRDQIALAHERVAAILARDLKAVVDRGGPRARDPKATAALLAGWCDDGAMEIRRRCGWL